MTEPNDPVTNVTLTDGEILAHPICPIRKEGDMSGHEKMMQECTKMFLDIFDNKKPTAEQTKHANDLYYKCVCTIHDHFYDRRYEKCPECQTLNKQIKQAVNGYLRMKKARKEYEKECGIKFKDGYSDVSLEDFMQSLDS